MSSSDEDEVLFGADVDGACGNCKSWCSQKHCVPVYKNVIVLETWTLVINNDCQLCVQGRLRSGEELGPYPVCKMLSPYCVTIGGPLSPGVLVLTEGGFITEDLPDFIPPLFARGFPWNWEQCKARWIAFVQEEQQKEEEEEEEGEEEAFKDINRLFSDKVASEVDFESSIASHPSYIYSDCSAMPHGNMQPQGVQQPMTFRERVERNRARMQPSDGSREDGAGPSRAATNGQIEQRVRCNSAPVNAQYHDGAGPSRAATNGQIEQEACSDSSDGSDNEEAAALYFTPVNISDIKQACSDSSDGSDNEIEKNVVVAQDADDDESEVETDDRPVPRGPPLSDTARLPGSLSQQRDSRLRSNQASSIGGKCLQRSRVGRSAEDSYSGNALNMSHTDRGSWSRSNGGGVRGRKGTPWCGRDQQNGVSHDSLNGRSSQFPFEQNTSQENKSRRSDYRDGQLPQQWKVRNCDSSSEVNERVSSVKQSCNLKSSCEERKLSEDCPERLNKFHRQLFSSPTSSSITLRTLQYSSDDQSSSSSSIKGRKLTVVSASQEPEKLDSSRVLQHSRRPRSPEPTTSLSYYENPKKPNESERCVDSRGPEKEDQASLNPHYKNPNKQTTKPRSPERRVSKSQHEKAERPSGDAVGHGLGRKPSEGSCFSVKPTNSIQDEAIFKMPLVPQSKKMPLVPQGRKMSLVPQGRKMTPVPQGRKMSLVLQGRKMKIYPELQIPVKEEVNTVYQMRISRGETFIKTDDTPSRGTSSEGGQKGSSEPEIGPSSDRTGAPCGNVDMPNSVKHSTSKATVNKVLSDQPTARKDLKAMEGIVDEENIQPNIEANRMIVRDKEKEKAHSGNARSFHKEIEEGARSSEGGKRVEGKTCTKQFDSKEVKCKDSTLCTYSNVTKVNRATYPENSVSKTLTHSSGKYRKTEWNVSKGRSNSEGTDQKEKKSCVQRIVFEDEQDEHSTSERTVNKVLSDQPTARKELKVVLSKVNEENVQTKYEENRVNVRDKEKEKAHSGNARSFHKEIEEGARSSEGGKRVEGKTCIKQFDSKEVKCKDSTLCTYSNVTKVNRATYPENSVSKTLTHSSGKYRKTEWNVSKGRSNSEGTDQKEKKSCVQRIVFEDEQDEHSTSERTVNKVLSDQPTARKELKVVLSKVNEENVQTKYEENRVNVRDKEKEKAHSGNARSFHKEIEEGARSSEGGKRVEGKTCTKQFDSKEVKCKDSTLRTYSNVTKVNRATYPENSVSKTLTHSSGKYRKTEWNVSKGRSNSEGTDQKEKKSCVQRIEFEDKLQETSQVKCQVEKRSVEGITVTDKEKREQLERRVQIQSKVSSGSSYESSSACSKTQVKGKPAKVYIGSADGPRVCSSFLRKVFSNSSANIAKHNAGAGSGKLRHSEGEIFTENASELRREWEEGGSAALRPSSDMSKDPAPSLRAGFSHKQPRIAPEERGRSAEDDEKQNRFVDRPKHQGCSREIDSGINTLSQSSRNDTEIMRILERLTDCRCSILENTPSISDDSIPATDMVGPSFKQPARHHTRSFLPASQASTKNASGQEQTTLDWNTNPSNTSNCKLISQQNTKHEREPFRCGMAGNIPENSASKSSGFVNCNVDQEKLNEQLQQSALEKAPAKANQRQGHIHASFSRSTGQRSDEEDPVIEEQATVGASAARPEVNESQLLSDDCESEKEFLFIDGDVSVINSEWSDEESYVSKNRDSRPSRLLEGGAEESSLRVGKLKKKTEHSGENLRKSHSNRPSVAQRSSPVSCNSSFFTVFPPVDDSVEVNVSNCNAFFALFETEGEDSEETSSVESSILSKGTLQRKEKTSRPRQESVKNWKRSGACPQPSGSQSIMSPPLKARLRSAKKPEVSLREEMKDTKAGAVTQKRDVTKNLVGSPPVRILQLPVVLLENCVPAGKSPTLACSHAEQKVRQVSRQGDILSSVTQNSGHAACKRKKEPSTVHFTSHTVQSEPRRRTRQNARPDASKNRLRTRSEACEGSSIASRLCRRRHAETSTDLNTQPSKMTCLTLCSKSEAPKAEQCESVLCSNNVSCLKIRDSQGCAVVALQATVKRSSTGHQTRGSQIEDSGSFYRRTRSKSMYSECGYRMRSGSQSSKIVTLEGKVAHPGHFRSKSLTSRQPTAQAALNGDGSKSSECYEGVLTRSMRKKVMGNLKGTEKNDTGRNKDRGKNGEEKRVRKKKIQAENKSQKGGKTHTVKKAPSVRAKRKRNVSSGDEEWSDSSAAQLHKEGEETRTVKKAPTVRRRGQRKVLGEDEERSACSTALLQKPSTLPVWKKPRSLRERRLQNKQLRAFQSAATNSSEEDPLADIVPSNILEIPAEALDYEPLLRTKRRRQRSSITEPSTPLWMEPGDVSDGAVSTASTPSLLSRSPSEPGVEQYVHRILATRTSSRLPATQRPEPRRMDFSHMKYTGIFVDDSNESEDSFDQ